MATLNRLKKIAAEVVARKNAKPRPFIQTISFMKDGKSVTKQISHYFEKEDK